MTTEDLDDLSAVAEPSERFKELDTRREPVRDVCLGEQHLKSLETIELQRPGADGRSVTIGKYLFKHKAETMMEYRERIRGAVLYPFLANAIDLNVGRVFARDPQLEEDVPVVIRGDETTEGWAENIDLAGRNLPQFARSLMKNGDRDGIAFIQVDMPAVPGVPVSELLQRGVRPVWIEIPCSHLIGRRSTVYRGAEYLTQARILESYSVPTRWDETFMRQVRVLEAGDPEADPTTDDNRPRFTLYREVALDNGNTQWTVVSAEDGGQGFIHVPRLAGEDPQSWAVRQAFALGLIPYYSNRCGFFEGLPPYEELAMLNLAHYRKRSDLDVLLAALQPQLFVSGMSQSEADDIGEKGPLRFWTVSDPSGDLKYAEPQGPMVAQLVADIERLEHRMAELAMDPQVRSAAGSETATAKVIDEKRATSILEARMLGLKDTLEQALLVTANLIGLPSGGSVSFPARISVSREDPAMIDRILAVQAGGYITRRRAVESLKLYMPAWEDLDAEQELDDVKAEGSKLQTAANLEALAKLREGTVDGGPDLARKLYLGQLVGSVLSPAFSAEENERLLADEKAQRDSEDLERAKANAEAFGLDPKNMMPSEDEALEEETASSPFDDVESDEPEEV